MRYGTLLVTLALATGVALPQEPPAAPSSSGQYVIQPGTRVPLSMINSINTKNSAAGDRIYLQTVFPIISNGKIEKESSRWKMPAWKGRLSKEQIWALIYFIEFQSGGIEGRFPPSLYPRGETADRP